MKRRLCPHVVHGGERGKVVRLICEQGDAHRKEGLGKTRLQHKEQLLLFREVGVGKRKETEN